MKMKLFTIIVLVGAVILLLSSATLKHTDNSTLNNEEVIFESDKMAFRCTIKDANGNKLIAGCWFCDCDALRCEIITSEDCPPSLN